MPSSASSSTIAVVSFKSSTYFPGVISDFPFVMEIIPSFEILKKSYFSINSPFLRTLVIIYLLIDICSPLVVTCAVGSSTVLSLLIMSPKSTFILLGST